MAFWGTSGAPRSPLSPRTSNLQPSRKHLKRPASAISRKAQQHHAIRDKATRPSSALQKPLPKRRQPVVRSKQALPRSSNEVPVLRVPLAELEARKRTRRRLSATFVPELRPDLTIRGVRPCASGSQRTEWPDFPFELLRASYFVSYGGTGSAGTLLPLPTWELGRRTKVLDLRPWSRNLADRTLVEIVRLCPDSILLDLSGAVSLTSHGVRAALERLQYLRHLDLSGCFAPAQLQHGDDIGAAICTGLLTSGSTLRSIALRRVPVSDRVLRVAARCCGPGRNLVRLDLCGCERVTDDGLAALLASCRSLEALLCSDCPRIRGRCFLSANVEREDTGAGHSTLLDGGAHPVQIVQSVLREMRLARCPLLCDSALPEVANGCPSLEILDLTGNRGLSDDGIVELVRNCTRLVTLSLAHCGGERHALVDGSNSRRRGGNERCAAVTDRTALAIADSCPYIESLDISGCCVTDVGLAAVVASCAALVTLSASAPSAQRLRTGSWLIAASAHKLTEDRSDVAVRGAIATSSLGSMNEVPSRAPFISATDINVIDNFDDNDCALFGCDSSAAPLQSLLGRLKSLHLCGNRLLDPSFLLRVSDYASMVEIDLSECALLTNIALEHVLRCAPKLTHLSASRCPLLGDDETVRTISSWHQCSHLVHLDISRLPQDLLRTCFKAANSTSHRANIPEKAQCRPKSTRLASGRNVNVGRGRDEEGKSVDEDEAALLDRKFGGFKSQVDRMISHYGEVRDTTNGFGDGRDVMGGGEEQWANMLLVASDHITRDGLPRQCDSKTLVSLLERLITVQVLHLGNHMNAPRAIVELATARRAKIDQNLNITPTPARLGCGSCQRLDLEGCDDALLPLFAGKSSDSILGTVFPLLSELRLRHCPQIHAEDVKRVLQNWPRTIWSGDCCENSNADRVHDDGAAAGHLPYRGVVTLTSSASAVAPNTPYERTGGQGGRACMPCGGFEDGDNEWCARSPLFPCEYATESDNIAATDTNVGAFIGACGARALKVRDPGSFSSGQRNATNANEETEMMGPLLSRHTPFGFSPLPGWERRNARAAYATRAALEVGAVTKLQSRWRSFLRAPMTVRFIMLKREDEVPIFAVRIQRILRGHLHRCFCRALVAQHSSASRIQRMVRTHAWRRAVRDLLFDHEQRMTRIETAARKREEWNAVLKLQKCWRRRAWMSSAAGAVDLERCRRAKLLLRDKRETRANRAIFKNAVLPLIVVAGASRRAWGSALLVPRRSVVVERGAAAAAHAALRRRVLEAPRMVTKNELGHNSRLQLPKFPQQQSIVPIASRLNGADSTASEMNKAVGQVQVRTLANALLKSSVDESLGNGNRRRLGRLTLCASCTERRPSVWCYSCRIVLCETCDARIHVPNAARRSSKIVSRDNSGGIKRWRPSLAERDLQYHVRAGLEPDSEDALSMSKSGVVAYDRKRGVHVADAAWGNAESRLVALEHANGEGLVGSVLHGMCTVRRMMECTSEVREVFRNNRAVFEELLALSRKRHKALEEKAKLDQIEARRRTAAAARLIQARYRGKFHRDKVDEHKRDALESLSKQREAARENSAVRIQAWARGQRPRHTLNKVWRRIGKASLSTKEALDYARLQVEEAFEPVFRAVQVNAVEAKVVAVPYYRAKWAKVHAQCQSFLTRSIREHRSRRHALESMLSECKAKVAAFEQRHAEYGSRLGSATLGPRTEHEREVLALRVLAYSARVALESHVLRILRYHAATPHSENFEPSLEDALGNLEANIERRRLSNAVEAARGSANTRGAQSSLPMRGNLIGSTTVENSPIIAEPTKLLAYLPVGKDNEASVTREAERLAVLGAMDLVCSEHLNKAHTELAQFRKLSVQLEKRLRKLECVPCQSEYHLSTNKRLQNLGYGGDSIENEDSRVAECEKVETKWVMAKLYDVVPEEESAWRNEQRSASLSACNRWVADLRFEDSRFEALKELEGRVYRALSSYTVELLTLEELKSDLKMEQGLRGDAAFSSTRLTDGTDPVDMKLLSLLEQESKLRSRLQQYRTELEDAESAMRERADELFSVRLRCVARRRTALRELANIVAGKPAFDGLPRAHGRPISEPADEVVVYYEATLPDGIANPHATTALALQREVDGCTWTAILPKGFFKPAHVHFEEELLQMRKDAVLRKQMDAEAEAQRIENLRRKEEEDRIRAAKVIEAERRAVEHAQGKVVASLLDDFAERPKRKSLVFRFKERWNAKRREAEKLEKSVLERQKGLTGFIEGYSRIVFTLGAPETLKFESKQASLKKQGLPHCIKFGKNLGKDDVVWVWVEPSVDPPLLLTELKLTHALPGHPLHISKEAWDARAGNWTLFRHDRMSGRQGEPGLVLAGNTGGPKPIIKFGLSYDSKDELRLSTQGFVQLVPDLGQFGLPPDSFLWVLHGTPGEAIKKKNLDVDALERQRRGFQELVDQHPTNERLVSLLQQAEGDLAAAQAIGPPPNKVNEMIEFLGLSKKEVGELVNAYRAMDADGSGEIDLEEFFTMIEVPRSEFGDKIFSFLDSSDDGTIDYAEFVYALGTYCMFGTDEILRLCFAILDLDGNGYITEPQLKQLFYQMHDVDPMEVGKLRRIIDTFDKDGDGKITFKEFTDMHRRYPNVLFPAFKIQHQMQKTFLGTKWWRRKRETMSKADATRKLQEKQRKQELEEEKRRRKEADGEKKSRFEVMKQKAMTQAKSKVATRLPKISQRSSGALDGLRGRGRKQR